MTFAGRNRSHHDRQPGRRDRIIGCMAALAIMMAPSSAAAARSAEPVRHAGPDGWPILSAVTIPAGSRLIILSGQVPPPIDPAASVGAMQFGNTRTQTVAVFRQIEALLKERGVGMGHIVKLTVFLVGDRDKGGVMDFAGFGDGYAQFFGTAAQPNKVARSVVQVAGLAHPGYLVEIEATAVE